MTPDPIKAQVIDLIADLAEVNSERVLPTSRLLHDLGIDGDDAVGLFKGMHERFSTDFSRLYESWSAHFGPEGFPLGAIIPAVAAGAIVATLIGNFAEDSVAIVAGAATTIALMAASHWIAVKLGLVKRITPVTVAQVVQAVEAGSWPRLER